MTEEQDAEYRAALRLLDAGYMQCNRLLRKATEFYKQPNAYTKSDLDFEIKVLKGLFGGQQ